jgi:hypothetical protein
MKVTTRGGGGRRDEGIGTSHEVMLGCMSLLTREDHRAPWFFSSVQYSLSLLPDPLELLLWQSNPASYSRFSTT